MVVLVFPACQNGTFSNQHCLLDYKSQNSLMANFINWKSGSTNCMNFILISLRAPERKTRLFWFLESEFSGQNLDVCLT